MWFPQITANGVLALATSVYGAATTALVISGYRDRQQRHEHFRHEQEDKKLDALYAAFCDAWGRWHGLWHKSGGVQVTVSEAQNVNEALIRLQAQLRLNGHISLADEFQHSVQMNNEVGTKLTKVGKAIGLLQQ
jgi:hypothetical protein